MCWEWPPGWRAAACLIVSMYNSYALLTLKAYFLRAPHRATSVDGGAEGLTSHVAKWPLGCRGLCAGRKLWAARCPHITEATHLLVDVVNGALSVHLVMDGVPRPPRTVPCTLTGRTTAAAWLSMWTVGVRDDRAGTG